MATRELKVRLNADATRFSRGMSSAIGRMRTFANVVGAATAALAAYAGARGLQEAIRESIRFEEKTAELQKLLGEVGGQRAADEIQSLSNTLPVARDRLLDVGAAAARLGIRGTENIRSFTQVMGEVGAATDLLADAAAESMARLAKITQTPISEIRNLASAVNAASNTMAASFSDVLQASLRAAPGLSAIGATQPEVVALAGSLSQVSASAERAGTRLNRLGSALADPRKFGAFADALDVSVQRFREMVDESPAQTILELARVMRRGGEAADVLAGELQETSLKVLRGLAQNLGETEEAVGRLNTAFEEGTSIGEEAARFFGITSSKLQVLENNIDNLQQQIGEHLLPTFNDLIGIIQRNLPQIAELFAKGLASVGLAAANLVEAINDNRRVIPEFASAAGNALSTFFALAVTGFRVVSNSAIALAKSLRPAAQLVTGIIMQDPGKIAAGIARLKSVLEDEALPNIENIVEAAEEGRAALDEFFRESAQSDLGAALGAETGDNFVDRFLKRLREGLESLRDADFGIGGGEGDEAVTPLSVGISASDFGSQASRTVDTLANSVQVAVDRSTSLTTAGRDIGLSLAQSAFGALTEGLPPGFDPDEVIQNMADATSDIGEGIGGDINENMDRVLERGAQRAMDSLLSGLIRGRDNILSSVIDIGLSIASAIATNGMMDFLQIGSPSRLAVRIGEQVGEGLIVGMQNMMGAVEGQSMAMAGAAAPSLPAGPAASGSGFGSSRQVVIHEGDRNVQIQAMDSESFRQFADRNRGIFGGAVARASRESQGIRHQILTGR